MNYLHPYIMRSSTALIGILLIFALGVVPQVWAQNTVGLTHYEVGNTDGYILFSPMQSTKTFLIDKCGEKVHEWNTSAYKPALSTFLLPDGSLLKTGQVNNPNFTAGGNGGMIERFDWDGQLLWSYSISDENQCMHHDVCPLPNGHILCIVWDRKSTADAILNGKDSTYDQTELWSEKIIELQPVGTNSATIVWEWKLWDHLVQDYDPAQLNYGDVSDHPELVNINFFPGQANTPDWIHFNSIDYNPALDQILLSSHTLCEVWILDHSTTTAEASTHEGGNSGHGGDLLYRWGNPQAYQRGNPTNKKYYGQHHATWIPSGFPDEGKILVFNNGLNRPGNFSSIDIIAPPLNNSNTYDTPATTAFLPSETYWTYTAPVPSDFYSNNISGVYPLYNGSFIITSGTKGLFFELDPNDHSAWSYINPVTNTGVLSQGSTPSNNLVFRCNFYQPDYAGLSGKTLTPLGEIELNPTSPSICDTLGTNLTRISEEQSISVYPNPFTSTLSITSTSPEPATFKLYTMLGQMVILESFSKNITLSTQELNSGIYFYEITDHSGGIVNGRVVRE